MRRYGRWLLAGLGAVLLLLSASIAHAEQKTVSVVLSHTGTPYQRFVEGIRSAIEKAGIDVRIRVFDIRDVSDQQILASRVIVTAGVNAMRVMRRLRGPVMIHALIPGVYTDANASTGDDGRKSIYIYLDQPFERVMRLVRIAFQQSKRVGLILGASNSGIVQSLKQAAANEKLFLNLRLVKKTSGIYPVLRDLVGQVDVFMLLPDKVVIKPSTIQAILLSTYHGSVPLLAYSPAFVRIGAVLAIYTSPYQAGVQSGEMLVKVIEGRINRFPVKVWAAYYTLKANPRVAESLGISLPGIPGLMKALKKR